MEKTRHNRLSKHFILSPILLFCLNTPPSVFAQKMVKLDGHFPQVSVLKVAAGVFQPQLDGRNGMSMGMSFESAFARRASWLVNTDLMFNPTDEIILLRGALRPQIQTRFAIQPEIRWYPKRVLRQWHLGFAAGFVGGFGKTGQLRHDGSFELRSFTEEIVELKFGWQQPFRKDFLWNVFASVGGLVPNDRVEGEAGFTPLLRCGVLVGTQR